MTLVIILSVIKFCYELIDGILSRFGITTKRTLKKQEIDTRIAKLEEHSNETYTQMNEIISGISDIKSSLVYVEEENDMRRIKDLKSEILAFSRSIKRFEADGMADDFTEEDFDRIFEAYREYEDLLLKHGMENGKTTRAMNNINKYSDKKGYGTEEL